MAPDVHTLTWRIRALGRQHYCLFVVITGRRRMRGWPIVVKQEFSFAERQGWRPHAMGASETLGILGGVEHSAQREASEALERNVGDLAILAIMELLAEYATELRDAADRPVVRAVLLVQGPVLPKLVGRIASLRLPRSICVGWFTPVGGFPWDEGIPGKHLRTAPRSPSSPKRPWEDESLVIGESTDDGSSVVQYLDLYRTRRVPSELAVACGAPKRRSWTDEPLPLPLQLAGLVLPLVEELPATGCPSPYSDPGGFVDLLIEKHQALRSDPGQLRVAAAELSPTAKDGSLLDDSLERLLDMIDAALGE